MMSAALWVSVLFTGILIGTSIYLLFSMRARDAVDRSLKHYEAYSTMMRAAKRMLDEASETNDPLTMARALHASIWLKNYADNYGRENGLPVDEWERANAE